MAVGAAVGPTAPAKASTVTATTEAAPAPAQSIVGTLVPFVMVFFGCMLAMVWMEYVLKADPKSGNMLSLTEFTFVLIQSLPSRLERSSSSGLAFPKFRPLVMSWQTHAVHAALWVTMSVLANVVYAFNITVPIHTLFRSCNVMGSVLVGLLAFGQRYSALQLVCVAVITVGILAGSVGDASFFTSGAAACTNCGNVPAPSPDEAASGSGFVVWSMGIAMLVFVQMVQATLSHTQASFYRKHSDRASRSELADEFLFTAHVISFLPMIFLYEDISAAWKIAISTPPLLPGFPVPRSICFVILNVFCQYMCIKGVFRLASQYTPLTVTITLSVRKFLSVLVSIWWFGNPWTVLHSISCVLVFGGVFAYSQAPPVEGLVASSDKKEK